MKTKEYRISQPKLGQIVHVGGVLKSLEPADSKTDPGFDNCPRFVGVIKQNKISNSYENYCISWCMVSCCKSWFHNNSMTHTNVEILLLNN